MGGPEEENQLPPYSEPLHLMSISSARLSCAWQWRVGVSLGKGEGDEGAEPGFTPRLRAAVDVGQAAGLMRSFINIMFGAMMDLCSSPA